MIPLLWCKYPWACSKGWTDNEGWFIAAGNVDENITAARLFNCLWFLEWP